jgi:hypothetical protein
MPTTRGISFKFLTRNEFPKFDTFLVFTRFMEFVTLTSFDECWEWEGRCNDRGYGRFHWRRKHTHEAHVASYLLFVGKIPKSHSRKKQLCVCHSCDNPSCVNPKHLWLGTYRQNTHDMMDKNRHNFMGQAKLTPKQVEKIKEKYATGNYSTRYLGRKYGVNSSNITRLVLGKSYGNSNF